MKTESNIRCLLAGLEEMLATEHSPRDRDTLNAVAHTLAWVLGEAGPRQERAMNATAFLGALAESRRGGQ